MHIQKLSKADIANVIEFNQAISLMLAYEKWKDLDDDHDDGREILSLRKRIARETGDDEDEVDGRIIAYEYMKSKYSDGLSLAIVTADTLIDEVCDPFVSHLSYNQYLFVNHVAAEQ